jgi:hypothetical protein
MKYFSTTDFTLMTTLLVMILIIALSQMGVHSYSSGNYFYSYTVSESSVLLIVLFVIGVLVTIAYYTGENDDHP